MTTVLELLNQLRTRDIKIWVENDKLRINAPKGALTRDLRNELSSRKDEILDYLNNVQQLSNDVPAFANHTGAGPYPLSFAQKRFWVLEQLEQGAGTYNIPQALRLHGVLDVDAFEKSVRTIIRRHEILRTTYTAVSGIPYQIIHEPDSFTLPFIDLSGMPDRETAVQAMIQEEARIPFDLSHEWPIRVKLIAMGNEDHVSLITMHHIASDGSSFAVLSRELQTVYAHYQANLEAEATLPSLPIQYADYAIWQESFLQTEKIKNQLAYWREQLGGELSDLEMPTDFNRPSERSFHGARLDTWLPISLTSKLKQFCQQENATLYMVLLAAFKLLLHRYSGQEDILVGSPIAGRNNAEVENLIGLFLNTLVLRTDLGGQPTFQELITRVREVSLSAFSNQDVPFEMVLEELKVARDSSRTPLFQVLFNVLNFQRRQDKFGDLERETIVNPDLDAKFDLTLYVGENDRQFGLFLVYNTDLFTEQRMQMLLDQYTHLLEQVVAQPDRPISHYSLMTSEAQALLPDPHQALDETWVGPIHAALSRHAAEWGEKTAVIDTTDTWTYAELNQRSNQLAHYLIDQGVQSGDIVPIYAHRSASLVWAVMGVLKAGAVFLIVDPAYPPARLADYLKQANPRFFLRIAAAGDPDPVLLDTLEQLGCKSTLLLPSLATMLPDFLTEYANTDPQVTIEPDDPACLGFTSGSTGQAKGVLGKHDGLTHFMPWLTERFALSHTDRFSMLSGLAHDPLQRDIFNAIWVGGTLCVPDPLQIGSPGWVANWLQTEGITVSNLTPAMGQLITTTAVSANQTLDSITTLQKVFFIGDVLTQQDVRQLRDLCPNLMIVNLYGSTETQRALSYFVLPPQTEETHQLKEIVPIGHGMEGSQLLLLNQAGKLAGIGEYAEIFIRSPHLALGYIGDEDLTRQRFLSNPYGTVSANDQVYKTGDMGRYLPDGAVSFASRADQQVKIRGFRVELGEIEAVLTRHPNLQQVVVIAPEITTGSRQLIAYVVPHPDDSSEEALPTLSPSDLRSYLSTQLPAYMVPDAFVVIEQVPLTPNGKVDRKALSALEINQISTDLNYFAPRTKNEKIIAKIMAEVLNLDQVGILGNFFEMGGHSLLATQFISRLQKELDIEIPLRTLFEFPTTVGLAQALGDSEIDAKSGLAPINQVERDGKIPLSFAQQRLWFLDQLDHESSAYHLPFAMRLTGPLHISALEQSLHRLIERHEVLRTTFVQENGEPVQKIHPSLPIELEQIDLRGVSANEQVEAARQQIKLDVNQPFDLVNGPLQRVKLFCLDDTDHIMLFTQHHIVTDGWSMTLIWRELTATYKDIVAGRPTQLLPLPIQYADYSQWQREWMQGDLLEKQIAYWKKQLGGRLPVLELPTDRPRAALQTNRGAKQSLVLSKALTDSLNALSQRENTTLFITLVAAFNVLLYRYTGQMDITMGSPIAGRSRSELEDLIGFFVNTLVLRTDLSDNPSFQDLLGKVHEVALEAFDNQDVPFEKLVEELQPNRDMSHSPLFQVMFALQNVPTSNIKLDDLALERLDIQSDTAMFDLSLTMTEVGQGLHGTFEYNSDLFEAATINRMVGHLHTLFEGIVAHPDQPIAELPLLTAPEQNQLLVEWNSTHLEFSRDKRIHQLFENQVEKTPDAVAVMFDHEQVTYRQLNDRANQLAHYLQQKGVGPDVIVGLSIPRSIDMIVGLFAVLKAGGAYLPLDPSYPAQRLKFMVEDARPIAILTQNEADWVDVCDKDVAIIDVSNWQSFTQYPTLNLKTDVSSDDLAYIIYTSGSTGTPKGVQIEHGAMVNFVQGAIATYSITDEDRVLQFATIAFDTAVEEIYPCLIQGATLVLRTDTMIDTMDRFLNKCAEWGITVLDLPTAFWHYLTSGLATEKLNIPSSVKLVIIGGEKANEQTLQLWQQHVSANVRLLNTYGPTEATVVTTVYEAGKEATLETVSKGIPIGRPLPNYDVYVLDAAMQPVPIGVAGELLIGGPGLARGYLNRPELTDEKFVRNPFGVGRLYRTGDLVRYLSDGNLEFMGRIDDQVKIRGYRIELGEIEAALTQHPQVRQAVVIAYEPTETERQLAAYLIGDTEIAIDELHQHLQGILPAYMVPASFTVLETLPLMPNGKVDRRALPEPARDGVKAVNAHVAPRTPIESKVAAIWAEVLKVELVGVHDDFFILGGHSLLATSVISRIRQAFSVDVPLRTLFDKPTIAGLAQAIVDSQSGTPSSSFPIEPVDRNGDLQLSFAQKRFWILEQMEQGQGTYNISQAVRLRGKLNVEALSESLTQLIARHEILRTTYTSIAGDPYQVVHDAEPVRLHQIDLSHAQDKAQQAERLVRAEATAAFDLSQDWPIRTKLIYMGVDDTIFLVTMHHIASDGWSFAVFMQELVEIYQNLENGKTPELPPLPVQYADYAAWQEKLLQDGETAVSLSYWKEQLSGHPAPLELPADFKRPAVRTFNGGQVKRKLPDDVTRNLYQFCQHESATLFMVLLATFKLLLHRYSGQEDILVGSPFAGRNRPELENMIGLFLNTVVLRTDLSGQPTYRELVQRVRDVSLSAFANQEIPFEMILEELKVERDLSRTPLFQVFFNVLNFGAKEQNFGSLSFEGITNPDLDSKFDLTLYVGESKENVGLFLVYNTDLFSNERMNLFLDHFMQVLEQAVINPDQRIAEFSLLTEAERQKILVEWNDTAVSKDPVCLHHLFEAQAAKTPDAIALTFNEFHLSYDALNRRANQLAHLLRNKYDVCPGKLVAIGVERSLEMVISILGVLKAGGAYVPLDPTHPQTRLHDILEDTQAPILITQERPLQNMPSFAGEIVHLDHIQPLLDDQSDTNLEPLATLTDLAYVVYTSGSTGKPKGVLVHHLGVAHHLTFLRQNYGVNENDVVIQIPTISFDASVRDTFTPLISGGRVVIISALDLADPMVVAAKMKEQQVTAILSIVPSLLVRLLEAAAKMDWTDHTMRLILTSGEALFMSYCRQAKEIFGPDLEIVNQYGPTECTMTSSFYRVVDVDSDRQFALIGRPVANTQIYLLDKQLNPVPVGVSGEIHIGGVEITYGYLNRPTLTAEKFIADPYSDKPNARLYKTGDLGRFLPDGTIEFIGRSDKQVKLRGYRVELGEIEVALLRNPSVKQAVVVAHETTPGDLQLVAYLVAKDGSAPSADTNALSPRVLRDFLLDQLPAYMVPAMFMVIDSVPLNSNGKINYRALPKPEITYDGTDRQYIAPRNDVEEVVSIIIAETLNLEKVSVVDNFFEMGGHSLLVTKVLFRIMDSFQVEFPLWRFFEDPTAAGVAAKMLSSNPGHEVRIKRTAQLLIKLSQMSDEEVAQMLKSRK